MVISNDSLIIIIAVLVFSCIDFKSTSNFEVEQGLLNNVIMLMKHKAPSLSEAERLCAISFNEVYISNKIEIDKKEEQTFGPHKTC